MAATSDNTIKPGDSNIVDAIREYFLAGIQKRVYEQSISRNLPGAVTIISDFSQGRSNKLEWTKSLGITTTDSTRYDIASTDLKLPAVEYGVDKDYVEASFKGGVVYEREDVMRDQEGYVMMDIQESLINDLTTKENQLFAAVVEAGTTVTGTSASVDLSETTAQYGVIQMRTASSDQGVTRYMLMNPNMTLALADYMTDASKVGDNRFLRENEVGQLYGARVVQSNYITNGKVVYMGDDAVIMYERMPYTLKVSQDEVDDLYYKFALKARFGMKIKRANRCLVATFAPEVLS